MAKHDKKQAEVFHFDLYGKRDDKYIFLNQNSIGSILWGKLEPSEPNYFFTVKNFVDSDIYESGFKVNELFLLYASGIKTQRDDASIKFTQKECDEIKCDFLTLSNDELARKYDFKDVRDWTMNEARNDLKENNVIANKLCYRPFDFRYMNYTGKTKGVQGYPRLEVMKHFLSGKNLGLILNPQPQAANLDLFESAYITNKISDTNMYRRGGPFSFPLYLFEETTSQQTINSASERIPNLNPEIVNQLAKKLGLTFTNEKETTPNTFAPIDILDYIYAVLHSPTYREKYKEFLKIEFPRVPYPTNQETFWQLVKLGGELRQIHLLESPAVEKYITQYPVDGDNMVKMVRFSTYLYDNVIPDENGNINYPDYLGSVYINETQYFANVPTSAWNFYIGGYQPAQKWLKDRKGRTLEFEDILHYQKIIVALTETDRIMKLIYSIGIE
ncbi:MAG: type ISP restriction/modification enzyme [Tenuifilaceae bacterium]|jgi:predicted helicase|nr:type ISP restriction/modification enzyme [Tenuifilaceae bacterium]